MVIENLYEPLGGAPLRVAGFMSGSGTNLVKIIEHEQQLNTEKGKSSYHVAVIFSDTHKSKANEIGAKFGVPVFTYDLEGFCTKKDVSIKDMRARRDWEGECMDVLNKFSCSVAAFAGYMRKATPIFVDSFLGINVHPADLRILGENGKPKYRGDHAVLDAIKAGEKEIRSTTHIITNDVDCGPILMVSAPLQVQYPRLDGLIREIADNYQNRLKQIGDWKIFPQTLEFIANGRFAMNEKKQLYFDGKKVNNGIILSPQFY
jgi:folate-dependent phosphoribosylglycinamide formyltransferase PurN